jgi:hypothetical protein
MKTKQNTKLGKDTGSFFNYLMANSMSVPEVGKGATILHWSDRSAYFVNVVSADGKKVILERAKAVRADGNGMSDSQRYKYERANSSTAEIVTITFRHGKWREVSTGWDGKTNYNPIRIIFGTMQEYYDYSF